MVNLEHQLVDLLTDKNLVISTAESCTGGLIAGRIINVPGVSQVYKEGFVTYANEAKMKYLNVRKETLDNYEAVSEETAREMAIGLIEQTGADVSLISTGLAGPDGGTEIKPVGLVYLGCCYKGQVHIKKHIYSGSREKIREQAVSDAIQLAIDIVSS